MSIDLKVHHIGYAVKNLQQSLQMFQKIGYDIVSKPIKDMNRMVEIVFVQNNNYLVEMISPISDESPIKNYINKIGNTPYHFCYQTEDIEAAITDLRNQRYIIIEKPSEAIAINNQRVAFLYHPKYGLLELLEV